VDLTAQDLGPGLGAFCAVLKLADAVLKLAGDAVQ
jgi:hypothetical protein